MVANEKNYCNISEETMIGALFDDVLLEIFKYCNGMQLKKASLVCKRWNEVIGSSTICMKKFKMKISKEIIDNSLDNRNFPSSRNHQNYYIVAEESNELSVVANCFELTRVKSFDLRGIRSCQLINDDIITLLSKMTKLEKLSLSSGRWTVSEESTQHIELPKLKTLLICSSYIILLKCIDAKELDDLQFTETTSINDYKATAKLLFGFPKLKRLTLNSCTDVLEHIDVSDIKFKLKYLEIYDKTADPINVDVYAENLRKFLLLQVHSLQELRLDFGMFDTRDGQIIVMDVLQIAFNKCDNLSSLDISNVSIPSDGSFYKTLSPNLSLKSLKVHWNFRGEVIAGLLRNSPNLEKLHAEYCYLENDDVNHIATLCKKLIHLDTFKMTGIAADYAVFDNLRLLQISKIEYSFDPLISLVAKSPVLEKINIMECKNSEIFPVDVILQKASMKKLIVQDKCYEMVTFKDNVRSVKESHFVQN